MKGLAEALDIVRKDIYLYNRVNIISECLLPQQVLLLLFMSLPKSLQKREFMLLMSIAIYKVQPQSISREALGWAFGGPSPPNLL